MVDGAADEGDGVEVDIEPGERNSEGAAGDDLRAGVRQEALAVSLLAPASSRRG